MKFTLAELEDRMVTNSVLVDTDREELKPLVDAIRDLGKVVVELKREIEADNTGKLYKCPYCKINVRGPFTEVSE